MTIKRKKNQIFNILGVNGVIGRCQLKEEINHSKSKNLSSQEWMADTVRFDKPTKKILYPERRESIFIFNNQRPLKRKTL